jgi:hypothetical protein
MNKQRTRRQRAGRAAARTLAVGVAVAALAATLGAGQALAATDERVLERQGRIDRQNAASQADEQGKAAEPSQHKATQVPRRFFRPEPPMDTSPRLDADQQLPPAPAPSVRADSRADRRTGLAVTLAVVALLLTVGAATIWRIRRRHPQPESTA